ncbi:MAG: hypothetical protein M1834_009307 [Cirrosporium novae-zelandiae]|nr:MAG: hypothetical protein M1834_009307 [Cirrosporium novae-zelandiae]
MQAKPQIASFVVIKREVEGHLQQPAVTTEAYTFMGSAARIARQALISQEGIKAMSDLVLAFDMHQQQNQAQLGGRVDKVLEFVGYLWDEFPLILIDPYMTDKSQTACYKRQPWQGEFSMRFQFVFRVDDMINAAQNRLDEEFRRFQFMFAMALIHEVGGHLLISFLTSGAGSTPEMVYPHFFNSAEPSQSGESGRYLEWTLFGGCHEWRENTNQGSRQAGIACLVDEDEIVSPIAEKVIDRFLHCDFEFPFPFEKDEGFDPINHPIIGGPASNVALPPSLKSPITPNFPNSVRPCCVRIGSLEGVPWNTSLRAISAF